MASTMIAVDLGNRIGQLRAERNGSQRELARRVGASSKSVISYYEPGERYPSYETLLRLADVFAVTADYLLRGNDSDIRLTVGTLTNEQLDALNIFIGSMRKG